jgi:hypothetical protein
MTTVLLYILSFLNLPYLSELRSLEYTIYDWPVIQANKIHLNEIKTSHDVQELPAYVHTTSKTISFILQITKKKLQVLSLASTSPLFTSSSSKDTSSMQL